MRDRFWGPTIQRLRESDKPGSRIESDGAIIGYTPKYEPPPPPPRTKLDDLKELFQKLTFREMRELVGGILPKGAEITEPTHLAISFDDWAEVYSRRQASGE